jgi:Na+-translocating ferredoxin:NAD+ oxidoreductase RnfD subunit
MTDIAKQLKNPKIGMLIVLTLLPVYDIFNRGQADDKLVLLAISIATALLTEWAVFGNVRGHSLQSAAISGAIIGLLISPGTRLLIPCVAAIAAIASKRLVFRKKAHHIFNPAAFGLIIAAAIFGNHLNWWGNSSVLIVAIGTGVVLYRINRLTLPISYFVTRTLSVLLFTSVQGLSGALLMPNLFFAFVMLVEPKTTPAKPSEQLIFGSLCGILATLFYLTIPTWEGDLLALLVLNLCRPLLKKLRSLTDIKHTSPAKKATKG